MPARFPVYCITARMASSGTSLVTRAVVRVYTGMACSAVRVEWPPSHRE